MIVAARWCLFMFVLAVAGFLLLALCATPAGACPKCGLFGNKCVVRQQVIAQQLVTPQIYLGAPNISYFVGQEVRVEAIVQKALREDPGYAEYQKFKAWQMGRVPNTETISPSISGNSPLNKPTETIPQTIPTSLLTTKCGTCHGGDAPKKGLLLDGTAKLNCEQVLKAMRAIQSGKMPPKVKLTGEEAGEVFHELLDLAETK